MSQNIRMSGETMRSRATEFNQEYERFAESITRMDQLISRLAEEWEGEASRAYAQRFADLKPAFNNTRELIQELCHNLNASAEIMEAADNEIAAKLK